MIEVQDLTKTFNGKTVVNGLNFQVQEVEIFGYLGPNRAGKRRLKICLTLQDF
jgi:ABC-2 type transport system ATP-binding protein